MSVRNSPALKCTIGKYRCNIAKRRIPENWKVIINYSTVTDERKQWCESHRLKVQKMVREKKIKVETVQFLRLDDKEIILFNDDVKIMDDSQFNLSSEVNTSTSLTDIPKSLNDDFDVLQVQTKEKSNG